MPLPRYAIHAMLSLWLLAAPAVQAEQPTVYVVGRPSITPNVGASCGASRDRRPGVAAYQDCARLCEAASRQTAEAAGGAALFHAKYVRDCARVSTSGAPAMAAQGIPQLVDLAYVAAAPGVGASAAGATGASAAAGGAGIGLTTVLVPVAVVGGVAAGIVAASSARADRPASP